MSCTVLAAYASLHLFMHGLNQTNPGIGLECPSNQSGTSYATLAYDDSYNRLAVAFMGQRKVFDVNEDLTISARLGGVVGYTHSESKINSPVAPVLGVFLEEKHTGLRVGIYAPGVITLEQRF